MIIISGKKLETKEFIHERKDDHIRICREKKETVYLNRGTINSVKLIHRALPEIDFDEIDPSVEFLGKKLSFPLIIGSMSGGGKLSEKLNKNIAVACKVTGIGFSLGSSRILFEKKSDEKSFKVRPLCPDNLVIANLGANQLDGSLTADTVNCMAEKLGADAFFIHLNPAQEIFQVEGDRNFRGISDRIAELADDLKIPFGLKETGMGFSSQDIDLLKTSAISFIDSSGNDGTNWALIEGYRFDERNRRSAEAFTEWGISSLDSLKNCLELKDKCSVIASGGINNGLAMLKALILGADAVSVSLPFLEAALESAEALVKEINLYREVFIKGMLLTGSRNIAELKGNMSLIADNDIVRKFSF